MKTFRFIVFLLLISKGIFVQAQIQWANKVIDFSSEYVDEMGSPFYRAKQVLGYPNTPVAGKSPLAWATAKTQMGKEFITVGFSKPQMVQQVIIGESYNPGAVREIILYDDKGKEYSVYENKNPGYIEKYGDILSYYKIKPTYNVVKLKLKINTDAVPGMSQIDCIGISSNTQLYQPIINVVKYSEAVGLPENLGAGVNSQYYDHLPIIAPDGKTLYFARKFALDNLGKENRDDIYFAKKMPTGQWGKAENIGEPLNNEYNNYVAFVSADNQRIYLANHYKKKAEDGVSMSTREKSGKWGKPKALNIKKFYNYNIFSDIHLNINENTMLLCLERDDSYGDLDMYVSFKYADGSWSEPQNLGPKINSVGAEGSAFLAADDKTIYFSSSGRQGFGSYDMYMTKRLDNSWMNWSEPINLGDKINTPKMDIYYSIPPQSDYIYYSSEESYYGLNDLYRIKLPKEARPEPVDLNKILADAPLKKEVLPNVDKTVNDLKNQQINTVPQPVITNPVTLNNETPKPATPTTVQPNTQADALQKKLEELKQQQQQPVTSTTIKTPSTTQPEPVKPTPVETPKSVAVTPQTTPTTTNPQTTELQQKLNELKQAPIQSPAPVPASNEPKVTYKTEKINVLPMKTEDELLKENKPKVEVKPFTPEEIAAQQKIMDNPNYNPANDNINNLAKKDAVTPDISKPEYKNTNTTTVNPTPIQQPVLENMPQNSNQPKIITQEIDPNTIEQPKVSSPVANTVPTDDFQKKLDELKKQQQTVQQQKPQPSVVTPTPTYTTPSSQQNNQQPKSNNTPVEPTTYKQQPQVLTQEVAPATITTPAPGYNAPLKKADPVQDDLQAKLDELKKQQQNNKINASTNTTDYNKPYDPNANTNYYPNPKPVTPVTNANTEALDQKLAELKQQQYQPQQSTRINDPNATKKYDVTTVKERVPDKASEEYDDFQKKLDELKNQQKNPTVKTTTAPSNTTPSVSNPAASTNPTKTIPTPVASNTPDTKPETPKTAKVSNPDLSKYEEKLKKLKEEMAAMGMPEKPVESTPTTATIQPKTKTAENTPAKPLDNYSTPTDELQKKLNELKQEQTTTPVINNITPDKTEDKISTTVIDAPLPVAQKTNYQLELEKAKLDSLQMAQKNAEKQLADMLDKMGNNKLSLEKDITDLKDKVAQFEKDKNNLTQQNTQLADEKKKLEDQKKQMDDMLALMQTERDRLAMEKVKMEQDKKLLDQLKKQQELEVFAMKRAIDSLAKIKAKAQYRADSILNLDPAKSPTLEVGTIIIADKILFMADASYLAINSYPEVDKIATFLQKNKTLKVEIGGHTNGLCDEAFCNNLSTNRAKTIVDYLVSKGIDRNRLTYKGYGKQFLVAPAGSPMNQRVEIKILAIK